MPGGTRPSKSDSSNGHHHGSSIRVCKTVTTPQHQEQLAAATCGNAARSAVNCVLKIFMNKLLLPALALLLIPLSSLADPTVTDVVARQRYPWTGLVDISFTISESGCIAVTATNAATGAEVPVRTLLGDNGNVVKDKEFASGEVSLIWNASANATTGRQDNGFASARLEMLDVVVAVPKAGDEQYRVL